jgi:hypothetical protein
MTQAEHLAALNLLATPQERLDYADAQFTAQAERLKTQLNKAILARVQAALIGDDANAIALQLARGEALLAKTR